jgi:hypothetical protein
MGAFRAFKELWWTTDHLTVTLSPSHRTQSNTPAWITHKETISKENEKKPYHAQAWDLNTFVGPLTDFRISQLSFSGGDQIEYTPRHSAFFQIKLGFKKIRVEVPPP